MIDPTNDATAAGDAEPHGASTVRDDDAASPTVAGAVDAATLPTAGPGLYASATSQGITDAIGPYKLIRQLGVGGMGEVWLAEQTHPVRRQVALKVIKAGMDTAQVVVRFEAERQALAMMDHPAIARVYEAGATPQGRPYFVMEYARGEPISAYCHNHSLTVHQRIDLLLHVCEGVQHAHQKGIIHRDLKPSNVLITMQDDRPVPKIIDFGVAKATSQTLTDSTMYTEAGAFVGTAEYMSPEQASGLLDLDTRTDVYALGAILYELLAGTLPFESKALRGKGLEELRRTICEVDPPRPSARVAAVAAVPGVSATLIASAQRLAAQLRGDLDWITMKALEKDRARRYGSASDLAADLRRHLEHQPVLAGPPSRLYKVQKFVRRHRAGVAAASVVLALLIAFAITMTVQAQRIARERDRANREAERANREASAATQVSEFLKGLFNVSDPSEARGNTLTAREILDTGADRIRNELSGQPEVQARLMDTMGTVYTSLGLYRDAEPLLKEAVETDRRTLGPDHPQTLAAVNRLANLYWYQDRLSEAEPLYLEAVGKSRQVLGLEHQATLRAQTDLASLYTVQKRFDEAERLVKDTADAQARVLGVGHADTRLSRNILQAIYFQQARYGEAEVIAREVFETSLKVMTEQHPDTLADMHNLATVYDRQNRFGEAESLYLRAIKGKSRVLEDTHPSTIRSVQRLATMYLRQKRFREAETQLLGAVAALTAARDNAAASPTTDTTTLDGVVSQLADLYDAWGQPSKAAEWRAQIK
jgi:non-specific serine/threonine protein kinase/serine/threonine-protein kinase